MYGLLGLTLTFFVNEGGSSYERWLCVVPWWWGRGDLCWMNSPGWLEGVKVVYVRVKILFRHFEVEKGLQKSGGLMSF